MTKSELEILECLREGKKLPHRKNGDRFRRHEKAVDRLIKSGVIYKDSRQILQIATLENRPSWQPLKDLGY